MTQVARVSLEYGQYSGEVCVNTNESEPNEDVIRKAWAQAKARGWLTLSQATSSAKVLERMGTQ